MAIDKDIAKKIQASHEELYLMNFRVLPTPGYKGIGKTPAKHKEHFELRKRNYKNIKLSLLLTITF